MQRVEGRENDINFFGRVLFSNQFSQEKLTQFRLLTHRETFQQSFIHSFVINQYDYAELKMYFKHERSNSSCSNRWLGIGFIVEIIRLMTLMRRTAFIMYVNQKKPLQMTGSVNKKNRVGLLPQKLKIDLSNTVNKADTELTVLITVALIPLTYEIKSEKRGEPGEYSPIKVTGVLVGKFREHA